MMVVVPTRNDVSLVYGATPALTMGNVISDLAVLEGLLTLWFVFGDVAESTPVEWYSWTPAQSSRPTTYAARTLTKSTRAGAGGRFGVRDLRQRSGIVMARDMRPSGSRSARPSPRGRARSASR